MSALSLVCFFLSWNLKTYLLDSFYRLARTFGNNLNGTLPSEITQLSKLESLILQNNLIRGPIPDFLAKVPLLNTLILSGNPMGGTIPEIVFQTTPLLGTIHLSRTMLNGTIPMEFSAMNVTDLRLDENALTGPIPSELGLIVGLRKYFCALRAATSRVRVMIILRHARDRYIRYS